MDKDFNNSVAFQYMVNDFPYLYSKIIRSNRGHFHSPEWIFECQPKLGEDTHTTCQGLLIAPPKKGQDYSEWGRVLQINPNDSESDCDETDMDKKSQIQGGIQGCQEFRYDLVSDIQEMEM
jgi:hypothetical protein